jgi:hypothetical protein
MGKQGFNGHEKGNGNTKLYIKALSTHIFRLNSKLNLQHKFFSIIKYEKMTFYLCNDFNTLSKIEVARNVEYFRL